MIKNFYLPLLLGIFCICTTIYAETPCCAVCEENQEDFFCYEEERFSPCHTGWILALGPEYAYVDRARKGGTKQTGNLIGGRFNFDRIKPNGFYIGAQGYYGYAVLKGTSRTGRQIKSNFTDALVEGSLGYTICLPFFNRLILTPYVGAGYLQEINHFVAPSPLPIKFNTHYGYVPFGLLTNYFLSENWTLGINVRFRLPWEPEVKVSNDPDFDDSIQQIGVRLTTRIEIPLFYCADTLFKGLEFGLTPFYENRHYGEEENYPFDFSETIMNFWGVNFQLIYAF